MAPNTATSARQHTLLIERTIAARAALWAAWMSAGLLLATVGTAAAEDAPAAAGHSAEQIEFFEAKIRPLLVQHCHECHGQHEPEAGLNLTSRERIMAGSAGGVIVAAGDPDNSRLVEVLRYQGDVQMPPDKKLADTEIAAITEWVKLGLPWPAREPDSPLPHPDHDSTAPPSLSDDPYALLRAGHWAFRPIASPPLPAVEVEAWCTSDVDRFILSALESRGLKPSPPADRRTLLRRASFDLTGLPPSPDEIDDFLNDSSPEAWSRVVDRLLASPAYGQRWARHWLDVARYADTKGYVFTEDPRYYHAWGYRDYVVRSLNEDLPFDRFLQQQIAADLLPTADDPRTWTALGFLTLGMRFMNNTHDIIDDRIDVVTRGLLGLTVTCARCHDHKFDPIPTADYYSLYGVFSSSPEAPEPPLAGTPEQNAAYSAYLERLRAAEKTAEEFLAAAAKKLGEDVKPADAEKQLDDEAKAELQALREQINQIKAEAPYEPPRAMALSDAPIPQLPRVFLRGNAGRPGPEVPRQFLAILSEPGRRPFSVGSGRLELAEAITDNDNPLTARVIVNRVWLHHFGHGLVETASDFGVRTEAPSHPELLDYLADALRRDGWSLKALHRRLMLSSVYQQSSVDRAEAAAIDPENRLLWRMNRRRLEFEPFRDALLAVAGKLDVSLDGPPQKMFEAPYPTRRSIYGFINRNDLPGTLRVFDFPSPDVSNPERARTTVPQQALFAMNAPLVHQQAQRLSERGDVAGVADSGDRIRRMYRIALGREATDVEVALGTSFVQAAEQQQNQQQGDGALSPWAQYAQVLLMSNEFAFVD